MRLFRRGSERTRALGVAVVVAVTVMAGCSETGPVGGEQATDADSDAGNVMADGGYKADDPDAEPVKVGFIGINDGPIAALPELLQATETAVEFVNAELGGVDGHPIELVPCSVSLSPESSQRCAREVLEADVVAVLGGIGLVILSRRMAATTARR